MTDLLNKIAFLINYYLLPLIFPGHASNPAKSLYYWIFNNNLILLFFLITFAFYIVRLFRRLIKSI